jgi:hypothetical protein
MPIRLYTVIFRMDKNDACHTIVRPFADHLKDKKIFLMAEELCIPKSYIKSIKLVNVMRPVKIDSDLRLGNVR